MITQEIAPGHTRYLHVENQHIMLTGRGCRSSTGIKGVTVSGDHFIAKIGKVYLGRFETITQAETAVREAAKLSMDRSTLHRKMKEMK
jgi:hypothetical protein